jgi:hypothetical protein
MHVKVVYTGLLHDECVAQWHLAGEDYSSGDVVTEPITNIPGGLKHRHDITVIELGHCVLWLKILAHAHKVNTMACPSVTHRRKSALRIRLVQESLRDITVPLQVVKYFFIP